MENDAFAERLRLHLDEMNPRDLRRLQEILGRMEAAKFDRALEQQKDQERSKTLCRCQEMIAKILMEGSKGGQS